jgi:hypothetical protein
MTRHLLFVGMEMLAFSISAGAQLAPPHRTTRAYTVPRHTSFQPPHFANAKARSLTYAMLRAERKLGPVTIHITGEGGTTDIAWDSGRIRQDGNGASWTYRSGQLTVRCKKGLYSGKADRADVLDYLAVLTGGADTLSRQLLLHQHPFEDFFTPDSTVRVAGTITVSGQRADILEISGRVVQASLWVRRKDHLVVWAQAASLSPTHNVIYRARRTYTYRPLGHTSKLFELVHSTSLKPKPLPQGAIKIGKLYQRG